MCIDNKCSPEYRAYLQSQAWDYVRSCVIERDKCCRRCGKVYEDGKRFQCHHVNYKHMMCGDAKEIASCRLYCYTCHEVIEHYKKYPMPETLERILGFSYAENDPPALI